MRHLLKSALDSTLEKVYSLPVPDIKQKTEFVTVTHIKPCNLPTFMASHSVPDNAYFDTDGDDVLLRYEYSVNMTEYEKNEWVKNKFNSIVFGEVYRVLSAAGYVRKGFSYQLLRSFAQTKVFDMYMAGEWDHLESYFSLFFVK